MRFDLFYFLAALIIPGGLVLLPAMATDFAIDLEEG